ncbi:helix-turn-helix domain-containing protein [Streptomyces sp. NBC_01205]|uniref:helix-turn-helix domain-containing protein n=1 Tax=Streptomyces sp. NBC_01205 TaxID=2903771 RepID=UPI002E123865|nr:helix-turn-helix domain-containing protein [Streptomyces sp. NBC_01205]
MHEKDRQPERYVKIGNHLAQHRELSLTAIGLSTYIQSLPTGADVSIKALAQRFTEGETRIASALRELEAHGYLSRTRERLPSGQIVTRTVSYNNPPARRLKAAERPVQPPATAPAPARTEVPDPDPEPEPGPGPEPAPAVPEIELQARELLARLRLRDPRLVLSERDTVRLAPAAAVWLERGLTPSAVIAALTRSLPMTPIHSPAGLLAHRLRELVPPRLPAPRAAHPVPPDREIHPLRTCDGCDRAFRSPTPGHCRGCAPSADAA